MVRGRWSVVVVAGGLGDVAGGGARWCSGSWLVGLSGAVVGAGARGPLVLSDRWAEAVAAVECVDELVGPGPASCDA